MNYCVAPLRLLALIACTAICEINAAEPTALLRSNDVIALVGGANIVSAQKYGYFETFLRVGMPQSNLRIRSLAHEGDTAYEQPRDYNYPTLEKQLEEYHATVVLAEFGQMEVFDGTNRISQFTAACDKLLTRLAEGGRRVILISPFPFESHGIFGRVGHLPDLSDRNSELREYVSATKALANRRGIEFIDLFSDWLAKKPSSELTIDGLHLNATGHCKYDLALARALGANMPSTDVGVDKVAGALSDADWEKIRRLVVEKNRIWFNYYRPMNWAFLNGDRTDQPSSHDPFNPRIRWFPDEMRKFEPLLDKAETEITTLVSGGAK